MSMATAMVTAATTAMAHLRVGDGGKYCVITGTVTAQQQRCEKSFSGESLLA
jgi:hypothetical protein